MSRAKLLGSLGLVFCWAGLALAQDPPPLKAPAAEPEAPKAAAPKPKAKPSTSPSAPTSTTSVPAARANSPSSPGSQVRPMLVIPGVTGPGNRPGAAARSALPQPSRAPGATTASDARRESGPGIAGPSDARSPFREPSSQPSRRSDNDLLSEPIPMSIEPLEDQSESEMKPSRPSAPRSPQDRSRSGDSRSKQGSRSVDFARRCVCFGSPSPRAAPLAGNVRPDFSAPACPASRPRRFEERHQKSRGKSRMHHPSPSPMPR